MHVSMNDDLRKVMCIIDKNSDKLPEGDYLELCNTMRDMYRVDSPESPRLARSVFEEGISLEDLYLTEDEMHYFYEHYEQRMRTIDIRLKTAELTMINKIIRESAPIRRITKKVKTQVVDHFCKLNKMNLPENSIECFSTHTNAWSEIEDLCSGYVSTENKFNEFIIRDLNTRARELKGEIELIGDGFI